MFLESIGPEEAVPFGTTLHYQNTIQDRIIRGLVISMDDQSTVDMIASNLEVKLNQNGNRVIYNNIDLKAIQDIGNLKTGMGFNNAAGIIDTIYVDVGVIVLQGNDRLSIDLTLVNSSGITSTKVKVTAIEQDFGINMPKIYISSNVTGTETFKDCMNLYMYNPDNVFSIGSHDDNIVVNNIFGAINSQIDDLVAGTVVLNRVELMEALNTLVIYQNQEDMPIAQSISVRVNGDFGTDNVLFVSESYLDSDPSQSMGLLKSRSIQMISQVSSGFRKYIQARKMLSISNKVGKTNSYRR